MGKERETVFVTLLELLCNIRIKINELNILELLKPATPKFYFILSDNSLSKLDAVATTFILQHIAFLED